jgi:hypothetical protein
VTAAGGLQFRENGTQKSSSTTYAIGDKLRVAIVSGVVLYQKNGVTLYTSLIAPAYPILVDTSIASKNASGTILDVVVGGGSWS